MKITVFPIKGLMLVNSKGRFSRLTLDMALGLWRAGIAQPADSYTTRCLISGFYTCGEA